MVSACASVSEDSTTPGAEVSTASTTVTVDLSEPTPVIVDYSPTVSDVGGLMYLLAHPDVEVIAISLPVTGEAGCDLGFEVTLGILAMFGQEEIPVACDPDTPGQARSWPSEFLGGIENLSFGLPASTVAMSDERASDLIARTAMEAGRPVVIYAVAPLTNVARAFDDHPDLADHVERIVIMGGAVDAPGNVGVDAPAPGEVAVTDAEWNFWIDVPAAAAVIGLGVPLTLVPLDATDFVPIPIWYQRALNEDEQTDAIVYLDRMVRLFPAVTSGFFFMWDELAASVAAGEALTTTEEMTILVIEGGSDDGRTSRDENGHLVTVATGVSDPDAFYANFLSTLAGSPVEVGSTATPEEEAYLTAVQDSFSELEEAFEVVFSDPALSEEAHSPLTKPVYPSLKRPDSSALTCSSRVDRPASGQDASRPGLTQNGFVTNKRSISGGSEVGGDAALCLASFDEVEELGLDRLVHWWFLIGSHQLIDELDNSFLGLWFAGLFPSLVIAPVRDQRSVEGGAETVECVLRPKEVATWADIADGIHGKSVSAKVDRLQIGLHHPTKVCVEGHLFI